MILTHERLQRLTYVDHGPNLPSLHELCAGLI